MLTRMQHFKERIINAWNRAWDHGDVDALDEILHPDYRRESASSGRTMTLAEVKQDILDIRGAFPGLVNTLDELVVEGDRGALFWNSIGTFENDLGEVPATGGRVSTRGSNLLRIRDERILHETVTWDRTELLSDVGVPSLRAAFEDQPSDVVVDDLSGDIDIETLKGFNRQFVTGVTVVTTTDREGKPLGLAVNSYASVSLEPPLVLVCVQKTSSTHNALFASSHLGINILSNRQLETVRRFAGKSDDKFGGLEWSSGPFGSPLIGESSASIEAEIKDRYQARTHTLFVARVVHAEVSENPPMIYGAGKFFDGAELTELS